MGEIFYYLFFLESDSYLTKFFNELDSEWGNCYSDLMGYDTSNGAMYLGLAMIVAVLGMTYVYYHVIDHPRFCKWIHWLLWVVLTFFVVFGISFWIAQEVSYSEFDKMIAQPQVQPLLVGVNTDISLYGYTLNLALTVATYGLLVAAASSFFIRFRSINCRKTPF